MAPALLAGAVGFLIVHTFSLLPSVVNGQPYSYIYFKGPGAKEPTFAFNLTHPGDRLPASRPTSVPSGVVEPLAAPAPAARNPGVTKTTGTTTSRPVSTLADSGINLPAVFLESAGKFPASRPRSQRNRASHMRFSTTTTAPVSELSRSEDIPPDVSPPSVPVKKSPLPRSVPQRSEVQELFQEANKNAKPFKFPKGKSGIMVRLPGGASYFVDFGTTFLERTTTAAPSQGNIPTTIPTVPPVTTNIQQPASAVRPPFDNFASQPLQGFPRQPVEITSKAPPRFTRPASTRGPSKRRFQAGIFFLSNNGSISSVPSTRKPFGRKQISDRDSSGRFVPQNPITRRPSTLPTFPNGDDREFNSGGRVKSFGRNRNRGQLGGAAIQALEGEDGDDQSRPEFGFEDARDDDLDRVTPSISARRTVPTRKPDVIRLLRERLRQQRVDEYEDFQRQNEDGDDVDDVDVNDNDRFRPALSLFDSGRRFNGIDSRPVTKPPERTRKPTLPSSRFSTPRLPPPPTSSIADVFGGGRTFTTTAAPRPVTAIVTTTPTTTTRRPAATAVVTSASPAAGDTRKPPPTTTTTFFTTVRDTRPPSTGTTFPDTGVFSRTPTFPTFPSFPTSNRIPSDPTRAVPTTGRPSLPTRAPTLITRPPTPTIFKIPVVTTTRRPSFATTVRTFPSVTFAFPTFPPSSITTSRPQTIFREPTTTTPRPTTLRSPITTPPPTFRPSVAFTTTFRPISQRFTTTERSITTTLAPTRAATTSPVPTRRQPTTFEPTTTRRPFTTMKDFAVTSRADFCPEKRYNTRHTLCLPKTCKTIDAGLKNGEEQEILYTHNRYRAQLATGLTEYSHLPKASDMLLLEWDDDLAATAQAHADLCSFDHDCPSCRRISKFASVGQNLCLDQTDQPNPQANWTTCITRWFEEAALVRPSDIHPYRFIHDTGHFTQMAWSRTWKIGCGYTMYPSKQPPYKYDLLYTCNYGPAGNTQGEGMYKLGTPCSQCPRGTKCMKNEFYGLCESTSPAGPIEDDPGAATGAVTLLHCDFNSFSGGPNDCDVTTNGPFITNAPFAIGSHTEVVLRAGQQARLTFQKQFPSENPICVLVNYDVGPAEFGKSSSGKMLLQVRGKNYEAEGNFGDPNDEGVRKFFYNVDTLGIVKKLELSFVFSVPAGSAETYFNLYGVQVIEDTCYGYYQKNQLRAKA